MRRFYDGRVSELTDWLMMAMECWKGQRFRYVSVTRNEEIVLC